MFVAAGAQGSGAEHRESGVSDRRVRKKTRARTGARARGRARAGARVWERI